MYKKIITVYCNNRTEHINTLCGQSSELSLANLAVHTVTTTELFKQLKQGTTLF
jgi:hypothetical protein